jgi:uncharacterized protein (TIGR00730 family)
MRICVYGAASNEINKEYILAGENLGFLMAKRGHSLVFGGGANGLMGAAARGVTKGGGKLLAVVPSFFNVDGALYDKCDDIIFTETMRIRKQTMEENSDAFIITPGGIGTFDEFFEMLTLLALGRHEKPIAILNTRGYYNSLIDMLKMGINEGFIKSHINDIIFVSESADEILNYIEK